MTSLNMIIITWEFLLGELSQCARWLKIAHSWIGNNLAAKWRLSFYLHCCAWSGSTLTANPYHTHLERAGNIIRWKMLTDFTVLQSETWLSQPQWHPLPFANYSLRNPECVSLGLGVAKPTQMFAGMKHCDYMVAALWPLECAFKRDSQAEYISLWHPITDYRAAIRRICPSWPATTPGTKSKNHLL